MSMTGKEEALWKGILAEIDKCLNDTRLSIHSGDKYRRIESMVSVELPEA